jgi:hypothetical protein
MFATCKGSASLVFLFFVASCFDTRTAVSQPADGVPSRNVEREKTCSVGQLWLPLTENDEERFWRSAEHARGGAIWGCTEQFSGIRSAAFAPREIMPLMAPDTSLAAKSERRPAPAAVASRTDEAAALDIHVAAAREAVSTILAGENACSAWFRQFDPDSARTFQSLHFQIELQGPDHVFRERGDDGVWIEHGPYIARTLQNTGSGSIVTLNARGAFFRARNQIYQKDWQGGMPYETGILRNIHVGPYDGGTLRAQIVTLLHELAHVVGAIPEDDSRKFGPGRSQQNTELVLRHCKAVAEISAKRSVLIVVQTGQN